MSSVSPYYQRRRLGRCPSPPTWAWYEQIPYPDDDSDNTESCDGEDSCSEDDEDYAGGRHRDRSDEHPPSSDSGSEEARPADAADVAAGTTSGDDAELSEKMPIDGAEEDCSGQERDVKKDIKGKQRAIDPPEVEESPKRRERRKRHRQSEVTFRPILTIQKSHGFVWNQDLFVPPYIKDRYVVSTSPPDKSGCLSSYNNYEVEVVEIRVKEGEYNHIIP